MLALPLRIRERADVAPHRAVLSIPHLVYDLIDEVAVVAGEHEANLRVGAVETHQKPALFLAAEPALPKIWHQGVRQFVSHPAGHLGHDRHQIASYAGFLAQLAQYSIAGVFARLYAALRHLPGGSVSIDALADKDSTGRISQHHPDAGPVRQSRYALRRHAKPGQIDAAAYQSRGAITARPLRMSIA